MAEWDATEDEAYVYDIVTMDVDVGDSVEISVTQGPAWLEILDHGDGTAQMHGTPENADVGSHDVRLSVTDVAGAAEMQDFSISVANANDAPYFTSTPGTQALLNEVYVYHVETADIDVGDTREVEIPVRPSWMSHTDHGDGTLR